MRLLIFLVFIQYGLFSKYQYIVEALYFLIPGVTIANQARL